MSDYLSDEFLYKHIPRAEAAALESLPTENELNHTFSGRFLRKMKALLKYERRGSFGRFATRLGRAVAAVLVVVIMLNTALVLSVEAYREKFFEIIQTVTERFTSFFVEVDDDAPVTEFVPILPPYIPEGFEEIERFADEFVIEIVYSNGDQDICYSQIKAGVGVMYIDTEDAGTERIQIGTQEVYAITEDNMITVYWVCDGSEFLIISNAARDRILAVAEGIIKK